MSLFYVAYNICYWVLFFTVSGFPKSSASAIVYNSVNTNSSLSGSVKGLYGIVSNVSGRKFNGIGAISGGGATSKLLKNYEEPGRSQILDFLFKPDFGASLQILKVEIGGDSQSSDGAETSHMHSEHDENYSRGYEWWLMTEAKKRNPAIQFYGLPWTFPGWLGGGQFTPYYNRTKLVTYIMNWIHGAKVHHGLDIDYIGVWNERPYDIQYIQMLKQALLTSAYSHVKTVAGDAMSWQIVHDYINSTVLQNSLDVIGYHYPGSYSPPEAQKLPIPLWASEEYSAVNDLHGGGCWARVLNEAYVNGLFTGLIAWNLISSYYNDLSYAHMGLMTANEPWGGHYDVSSPIWMSAHHTQFTQIGWHYLPHGQGSGNLTGNGTFVSYTSPDMKHLTIVVETMEPVTSPCFYHMPKYGVSDMQQATFTVQGKYKSITQLNAWYSKFDFEGKPSQIFESVTPVKVVNGTFSLELPKNVVITLTTVETGHKGTYPSPPPSAVFPVPYKDDFEGYKTHQEPFNLVQQAGVWEVQPSNDIHHGNVIRQMVTQPPIDTCRPKRMPRPVAIIGNFNWSDVSAQIDVSVSSAADGATGVFIGARARSGGCNIQYANGLFCSFYMNGTARLSGNFSESAVYREVTHKLELDTWYTISIDIVDGTVRCGVDDTSIISVAVSNIPSPNGFLNLGTTSFGSATFDNLYIKNATICKNPSQASSSRNSF